MMNDRLSSIMTTNVVTVSPDATLADVKIILFDKGYHHIPVVDAKNQLKGIITSFDLMRQNLKFEEYGSVKVSDVMTKSVATLHPNELVGAAALVFLKHLFHGIPIVNYDNELQGIVTTHDVLKYEYQKEYPNDEFAKSFLSNGVGT